MARTGQHWSLIIVSFIGEVERGNMEISLGPLLKIAGALEVRVQDLVKGL
jgi:hypothetical protein